VTAAATRRRLLLAATTDATFERTWWRGEEVWEGRCLHCRRRLRLAPDGTPLSEATVEHVVASAHGGGDDAENLAIACARCNHEKGVRHDRRHATDARRLEVEAALLAERRRRWRAPEDAPTAPPPPPRG
jgi:5-methylcytosine-specific restriction endonuclease McrA